MRQTGKNSYRSFPIQEENPWRHSVVLGGIFSEGIDLKEDLLIGVLIVGTGLPQICNQREILKEYYDAKGEQGFDYAYRYPGMNKVLQSAGRVIRTEKDKGVILLMDERFQSPHYRKMFPREWSDCRRCTMENVTELLTEFWKKIPPDPENVSGKPGRPDAGGDETDSSTGFFFQWITLPPDGSNSEFLRCLGKRELLIVCDDQRTLRHLFVHIQGEDTVRFFGDTVIRNKCNSESDACKVDQKIVACQLNLRNKV